MSFLDDAQTFLKQKQNQQAQEQSDFLETSASREAFEKELRELYENATWNKIRGLIKKSLLPFVFFVTIEAKGYRDEEITSLDNFFGHNLCGGFFVCRLSFLQYGSL